MTWYDPQEIKDQADGDKVQPEFNPEATEGYTDVEGEVSDEFTALFASVNDIANIVGTEITNGPQAVS